jgi:hypothetical protein
MTTETFWFELVRTLGSTVTAVAAVIGVVIAAHGLNKWQAETAGKLRIGLAEGVLADFYEARDIIQAARSPQAPRTLLDLGSGPPLNLEGEPSTRRRVAWETPVMTEAYDKMYVAASRLENKTEFFSKLHARRYRFVAHFGPEAAKPYEEVRRVHDEIIIASRYLVSCALGGFTGDPKVPEQWKITVQFDPKKEDQIAKRLDAAIAQMEQTCRPIIQAGVKPL